MPLFTGKHTIRLAEAASTNQVAQQHLGASLPDGTVVLAYHQTQGRGQQGNTWQSPPGQNLTFSIVYYPTFLALGDIFLLSKAVALGLYEALGMLLPEQDVWIKWPNDLLLNGRKVAGILIENQLSARGIASSIIGIGLNVNQMTFDPALQDRATSLQREQGDIFDLEKVLDTLLGQVERFYRLLQQGQKTHLDRAYLQALYKYQELTSVRTDKGRLEARIMGVNGQGKLGLLMEGEASIQYFAVKEAHILLPGEISQAE